MYKKAETTTGNEFTAIVSASHVLYKHTIIVTALVLFLSQSASPFKYIRCKSNKI